MILGLIRLYSCNTFGYKHFAGFKKSFRLHYHFIYAITQLGKSQNQCFPLNWEIFFHLLQYCCIHTRAQCSTKKEFRIWTQRHWYSKNIAQLCITDISHRKKVCFLGTWDLMEDRAYFFVSFFNSVVCTTLALCECM